MKIRSYPKINIGLKVFKDKCNESKHKIDSIFYLINNFYDVIDIESSNKQSITYLCNNKKIEMPDCLIAKTLDYLKDKFGFNTDYKIIVNKNIPLNSGLGGASSDAATIINYILSKNKPTALDLKDIALNLGSDIPFFLTGYKIARVKRYGEYVSPLTNVNPKIELLLTKIKCSTKVIFNKLDEDKNYQSKVDIDTIFNMLINKQHNNVVYNDLTKYIIESNTKLQEITKSKPDYFFSGTGGTLVRIEVNENEN